MQYGQIPNESVMNAELVVIGAGGAGCCAAVAAAEKGVDVILLEKKRRPGGNTAIAAGMFAIDSPLQKRMGIEIDKEKFFTMGMDFTHWEANPELMRNLIYKSGRTLEWLEEKGVTFSMPFHGEGPDAIERSWGDMPIPPSQHVPLGYGTGLIQLLTDCFEKAGGRLFCDTGAKKLLVEDGKLVGVLADYKGREIRINAENVVLSTGDFGGNVEMMKQYIPFYSDKMYHKGVPNMGDGHIMGHEVGGAYKNMAGMFVEAGWVTGEPNEMWYFTAIRNQPIWLNKKGKRFVNEASYRTRGQGWMPCAYQPDCLHYSLFDQGMLDAIIYGYDSPHFKAFGRRGNPPEPVTMEEALKLLTDAASRGKVCITESLDEVADFIGAPRETVKETVENYQHFCETGHDTEMGKEPRFLMPFGKGPYYCIRNVPRFLVTMGGLDCNENLQVKDENGDVLFEGLYAGGDTVGGFECKSSYNANIYGTFMGWACTSGRIAGEHVAKRLGKG